MVGDPAENGKKIRAKSVNSHVANGLAKRGVYNFLRGLASVGRPRRKTTEGRGQLPSLRDTSPSSCKCHEKGEVPLPPHLRPTVRAHPRRTYLRTAAGDAAQPGSLPPTIWRPGVSHVERPLRLRVCFAVASDPVEPLESTGVREWARHSSLLADVSPTYAAVENQSGPSSTEDSAGINSYTIATRATPAVTAALFWVTAMTSPR